MTHKPPPSDEQVAEKVRAIKLRALNAIARALFASTDPHDRDMTPAEQRQFDARRLVEKMNVEISAYREKVRRWRKDYVPR